MRKGKFTLSDDFEVMNGYTNGEGQKWVNVWFTEKQIKKYFSDFHPVFADPDTALNQTYECRICILDFEDFLYTIESCPLCIEHKDGTVSILTGYRFPELEFMEVKG